MNQVYLDSARLMTRVAPLVFVDDTFALKGGTAINLLCATCRGYQSISIWYFPTTLCRAIRRSGASMRRSASLLHASRRRLRNPCVRRWPLRVKPGCWCARPPRDENRGQFRDARDSHSVRVASLKPNARDTLKADLDIPVVSLEDIYGGKLVAAMDRQHPRDLFDVMQLFVHEGITAGIRRAFVIYLASHNRPVHEVLFPSLRDIRNEYEQDFEGMTVEPVELKTLLEARGRMVREVQPGLTRGERWFLLSLVAASPNGSCWESSIWSSSPDCNGSCKTSGDCRRATPKSSPINPRHSRDYSRETQRREVEGE